MEHNKQQTWDLAQNPRIADASSVDGKLFIRSVNAGKAISNDGSRAENLSMIALKTPESM